MANGCSLGAQNIWDIGPHHISYRPSWQISTHVQQDRFPGKHSSIVAELSIFKAYPPRFMRHSLWLRHSDSNKWNRWTIVPSWTEVLKTFIWYTSRRQPKACYPSFRHRHSNFAVLLFSASMHIGIDIGWNEQMLEYYGCDLWKISDFIQICSIGLLIKERSGSMFRLKVSE